MGYFPNGTAGEIYEAEYCDKCVHQNGQDGESGCAVWLAHLLRNYDECNDDQSILHMLIPRSDDGLYNKQCLMFWRKAAIRDLFDDQPRAAVESESA